MKKILKKLGQKKMINRVILPIGLIIILAAIGYFSFRSPGNKNITPQEAQTKAENFINAFLMQSGSKATIKEITNEYGLYKLKVDIVSDVVESYLTKDGKLFFPQALDVNEITQARNQNNNTQIPVDIPKNSKPVVELFVMSYCPYGTQIEKGILPVLETLGDKIDFELKFCDYAMHGEKELSENLLQYCIQKEQNDKFNAYLKCFLEEGDSTGCLDTADINKSKLNSCINKTDKQYKVTENYTNKVDWQGSYPGFNVNKSDNEKYNVGGSPTLIINGQQVSSNRDAASLLNIICSAFENSPKECETSLSSDSPTAGFGFETTSNNEAAAGCAN